MYTYISKSMRYTKNESGIQPTLLHYIACLLAVAIVCCSLLCIFLYTTSAYASTGVLLANGKTMSGQVVLDDTETDTPRPTATNTLSPTVSTSIPNPSPSTTRTVTPSPTSTGLATPTATVQHSGTVTGTQTPSSGAQPTSTTSISITTLRTDANQIPATTNNMGDQSNQGSQIPANNSPFSFLKISLGSLALLGLLFISWWMIVRRRLPSKSSSKFAPNGAAPWSRTHISNQVSPFTFQETMTSNVLPAGMIIAPPGSYSSSAISRPESLAPGNDPTASLPAFQKQLPDTPSEDIAELSDTYFQSLIQLHREKRMT